MTRARLLVWAAVVAAGVALLAAQRLNGGEQQTVGRLGHVPTFSLTDQAGRTVTDRDLRGSLWVASFIFTRCPSACPMLTAKFKALQGQLSSLSGIRYVSISVDPEHDTPEVLAAYARRFGADTTRWSFLTGPLAQIEQTVVKGFKIHIGTPQRNANNPTLIDIMHGEHFVLVDREGTIRGYYRAELAGLDELKDTLRALAH